MALLLDAASRIISAALGETCEFHSSDGVGGDCIHRTMVAKARHGEIAQRFFIKSNDTAAAA